MPTARTPKSASPSIAEQVGNFAQWAFPTINTVRTATKDRIGAALANDDYIRAAGAATMGVPASLLAGATDVVGRPLMALGLGAGRFFGGALGSSGSETDAIKTAPALAPALDPVAAALTQGRAAAATPITAQERINQFIAGRLEAGVTNHDLQALAAIGGVAPALGKVSQTNKDIRIGLAGNNADEILARQVAEIDKMPAGDARDKAYVKAGADAYTRNATLGGVNPQGLTMQQMLDQDKEAP